MRTTLFICVLALAGAMTAAADLAFTWPRDQALADPWRHKENATLEPQADDGARTGVLRWLTRSLELGFDAARKLVVLPETLEILKTLIFGIAQSAAESPLASLKPGSALS